MKRENFKKIVVLLIAAAIIIAILPTAKEIAGIPLSKDKSTVTVEIPQGASVRQIGDILKQNKLIHSKAVFSAKVRASEYASRLNYGTFKLSRSMNMKQMIKTIAETPYNEATVKVTFPEGYSAEQMGAMLEKEGVCTADEFYAALGDSYDDKFDFLKSVNVPNAKYRLQGYLFPNTYEFFKGTDAHSVVEKMLGEFEKNYFSLTDSRNNITETVIKASMIEKEARVESERPKIAGVIENRLKNGMLLQIDACVVYAATNGMYDRQTIYKSDLNSDSPYNTYKNKGLPAGAICNPGMSSLRAALYPESHEWLYYHTDEKKKDGSHIFTKTYDEHLSTMGE